MAFPPPELEGEHLTTWRSARADATVGEPAGSPVISAWDIGAWWALVDWCEERGMPCVNRSASYLEEVFGSDPRSINDCGWHGVIGGAVADGYEQTSALLGNRIHVMLPELFEKHYVPDCPG
jgi:hypothetical protein